jgi:TIGR03009 family protein
VFKPILNKLERKYVCSGMWFYNFDIGTKTIFFQRMQNQNMKPDDGPFAFLFGMKANEANKRFDMSVVQYDKNYTWVKVNPLTPQDQRDFKIAQLGVVNYANALSPKYFPLRIMWKEPSNNDISWEFKEVIRNDMAKVTMNDFSVELEKKAGWQLREVPPQGAAASNTPPGIPTSGNGAPRK